MDVMVNSNKRRFKFGSSSNNSSKKLSVPSLFVKTNYTNNNNFKETFNPDLTLESSFQKRISTSSSNTLSTLSSGKSTSTDTSSRKTISSKPIKHTPRNHSVLGKQCSFCGDQFLHTFSSVSLFSDNKIINLTCGHEAHYDCYLIFIEPYGMNELPVCTICNRPAKPMNSSDFDKITEIALSGEATRFIDDFDIGQPKSPIIYNAEKLPYILSETGHFDIIEASTPISNISNPISKEPLSVTEYHQDILMDLTKPQIKIIPEYNCFEINESRTVKHNLPLVLNVSMSRYPVRQQILNGKNNIYDLKLEFESYLKISNWIIMNYLSEFCNFKEFNIKPIDFEVSDTNSLLTANEDYEISHNQLTNLLLMDYKNGMTNNYDILVMFDALQVSLDPSDNYEYLQFFLFENDKLLIVKDQSEPILGIVKYKADLSSIIQVDDNNLILTFSTMCLDEIKIRSSNKLIITKWKNYLFRILSLKEEPAKNYEDTPQFENADDLILDKFSDVLTPLIQMTYNIWELLPNNLIPEDIKHIRELFHLNEEQNNPTIEYPLTLLKKLIPEPVLPPFRFTICILLVNNNPEISNNEYISQLKKTLQECLHALKSPNDKLGIVYISYDPTNKFKPYTSSYITDISDWETLSNQFNDFNQVKTLEEEDHKLNNVEQATLYMEAAERLFEFWGDLLYDEVKNKANNFKYVKKMVMLLDGYDDNEIVSLSYDSKKTLKKTIRLLQRIIREFKFSIHCKLINCMIDKHAIMFANLLIFENYFTIGSSFERLYTLTELKLSKKFQDWKKIIVPSLKIIINSKNSNIKLWRNEFRNNFLSLLDFVNEPDVTDITSNLSPISKTNPFMDSTLLSPISPTPSVTSFNVCSPTSTRKRNSNIPLRSSNRPSAIRPGSPFSPTSSEFIPSPTRSMSSPSIDTRVRRVGSHQTPVKMCPITTSFTTPNCSSSVPSSATSSKFSFNEDIFQDRFEVDRSSVSTLNISRIQRMNVDHNSSKNSSTRDLLNNGNDNSFKTNGSIRGKRSPTSTGLLTSLDICESPISPFMRTGGLSPLKFNSFDESIANLTILNNDSTSAPNKGSFDALINYYFGSDPKDSTFTESSDMSTAVPCNNSLISFDDNHEEVIIFVNDIKPGFNKNIIINANFEFDRQFKRVIKHSINNDPLGINNGLYKCNILSHTSLQNSKEISPKTEVGINIGLASVNNNNLDSMRDNYGILYDEDVTSEYVKSRNSIRHTVNSIIEQQQLRDTFDFDNINRISKRFSVASSLNIDFDNQSLDSYNIRDSIKDKDFELPIFPTPLTNTRDHLYARRQIQLTIISTLIYASKLAKSDISGVRHSTNCKDSAEPQEECYNPNLTLSKSLILGLTSSIFAMGKNVAPKQQNFKDYDALDEEDDVSDKDDISDKKLKRFVEHMKLILTMIADMYVTEPNQACMNSYELIFELCFNM